MAYTSSGTALNCSESTTESCNLSGSLNHRSETKSAHMQYGIISLGVHGRSQDFFQGWAVRGCKGCNSPRESRGLGGAKTLEADIIFSK